MSRWTDLLLRNAASRWPQHLRAEAMGEWQAEIAAISGRWRRHRFAWSLATSNPYREAHVPLWQTGLGLAGSVLAIAALGEALGRITFYSTVIAPQDSDWIAIRIAAATVSIIAAVVFGLLCARWTSSITGLIRPLWIPLWAVALSTTAMLGLGVWENAWPGWLPERFDLINISVWAAGAVALSWAVQLIGPARRAWAALGLAIMVTYLLHITPYALLYDLKGLELLFTLWTAGTLPVTIFLMVYAHRLVRTTPNKQLSDA
jgi:hypothetical protein